LAGRVAFDPVRKWGVSRTVGFCSSSWRKAAQKLKQRRVDFGQAAHIEVSGRHPHQPDVAKDGAPLTHQFDHIDAESFAFLRRGFPVILFDSA
jgi:hypothetical protein